MKRRYEFDSIGCMDVPYDAYYGVHTLRAKRNFSITNRPLETEFVKTLVEVKKAAAAANFQAGDLPNAKHLAIMRACDYILAGNLIEEFIVDAIQGGAGTSANMNVNEVIANKALEFIGYEKGRYDIIHPNDDVNMSQSTNDVIPTAGKITAVKLLEKAKAELQMLSDTLKQKSVEFQDVIKMGRTQLQDAVPISMGQVFHAYYSAVERDITRFSKAQQELCVVNIGGTAIGTSVNASEIYFHAIPDCIFQTTGVRVSQADDLIDATQNLDSFVYVSGIIKTCAVSLSKICNDLRLLSSGPKTGLDELHLPSMQNGSSIMPGKINPVIPEVVSQVAFNIIGNDTTITMAAEAGQLELNAFEPVLLFKLFESISTLEKAVNTLTRNCICDITVNKQACRDLLERSVGVVTALCPQIGYNKAAELAKKSLQTGKPIRNILLDENILSKKKIDILLNPVKLTHPLRR
ncbi:MAG: aspartate ammonia-lyase [Ethanoligenens sp.]